MNTLEYRRKLGLHKCNLVEIRAKKNWSQEELAFQANSSTYTIRVAEKGGNIKIATKLKFSLALNVPVSEIWP